MSTATRVPETWELTGDHARRTLMRTGRVTLVRDAFVRFRAADGFSHARSLAFATALVLVQGLIVIVGFAAAFGDLKLSRVIVDTIQSAVPGPAGELLTDAVHQANTVGRHDRYLPLVLGLVGTVITLTTALGQVERSANRIYGVERDRPSHEKYARALGLAMTVGVLFAASFVLLAFGRDIGQEHTTLRAVWLVLRWPIGLVVAGAALAALMRHAPRRHQPRISWLAFGATVGVLLWGVVTLGFTIVFNLSSSFGDTYGPLAGIVALQLWTFFSSVAILYGVAIAAQLEAVRAGEAEPAEPDPESTAEPVEGAPLAASAQPS